jgi:hypothetical protein
MVRIVNTSDRVLLPQSEFVRWGTLELGYRWSPAAEKKNDPNLRTPFPARILPNHQHDALVRVKAPGSPGTYQLQIDILEENKMWFSEGENNGSFERCTVDVQTLVWPPQFEPNTQTA